MIMPCHAILNPVGTSGEEWASIASTVNQLLADQEGPWDTVLNRSSFKDLVTRTEQCVW